MVPADLNRYHACEGGDEQPRGTSRYRRGDLLVSDETDHLLAGSPKCGHSPRCLKRVSLFVVRCTTMISTEVQRLPSQLPDLFVLCRCPPPSPRFVSPRHSPISAATTPRFCPSPKQGKNVVTSISRDQSFPSTTQNQPDRLIAYSLNSSLTAQHIVHDSQP